MVVLNNSNILLFIGENYPASPVVLKEYYIVCIIYEFIHGSKQDNLDILLSRNGNCIKGVVSCVIRFAGILILIYHVISKRKYW